MNNKIKQYAEMLIAMSTDYLIGNYDESLYVDMIHVTSKNLKKLNEEVLVQEKSCENCKLYTPLGNRLCAICYPPDFHYWKSKT